MAERHRVALNAPLTKLAADYTVAMHKGMDFFTTTVRTLRFCERLGLLHRFGDGDELAGFIAYARCYAQNLDLFRCGDLPAIFSLSRWELTRGGECLIYIEVFAAKPRRVITEIHQLAQLPGVELTAAWRDEGTRWKVQKVRQHEQRRERATSV